MSVGRLGGLCGLQERVWMGTATMSFRDPCSRANVGTIH